MFIAFPRNYLPLEIFAAATVIFFAGLWTMSVITTNKDKHH